MENKKMHIYPPCSWNQFIMVGSIHSP